MSTEREFTAYQRYLDGRFPPGSPERAELEAEIEAINAGNAPEFTSLDAEVAAKMRRDPAYAERVEQQQRQRQRIRAISRQVIAENGEALEILRKHDEGGGA